MFAVRANHAFDGEDFRAGGATVLVQDGGIVGVEPVGYAPPSDCELLDYGNATVLPGLIDSHVRNADAMNIAAKQASSMAGTHRSRIGGSAAAATEWRRRGRAGRRLRLPRRR